MPHAISNYFSILFFWISACLCQNISRHNISGHNTSVYNISGHNMSVHNTSSSSITVLLPGKYSVNNRAQNFGKQLSKMITRQKVMPILELSIKHINANLKPNQTHLTYKIVEIECEDSLIAAELTWHRYHHHSEAVFAPLCHKRSQILKELLSYWNMPLISLISDHKKSVSSLININIAGSFWYLSSSVRLILKEFMWNEYILITDSSYCEDIKMSFVQILKQMKSYIPLTYSKTTYGISNDFTFELYSQSPHVNKVVICGEKDFTSIVIDQFFDSGLYKLYHFIHLDFFSSKNSIMKPWQDSYKKHRTDIMLYWKRCVTITMRSTNIDILTQSTNIHTTQIPQKFTLQHKLSKANYFLAACYDAILYFSRYILRSKPNSNQTNGMTKLFEGITGDVYMDENNTRCSDLSIQILNDTKSEFEEVAVFHCATQKYHPIAGRQIVWQNFSQKPVLCSDDDCNQGPDFTLGLIFIAVFVFVFFLASYLLYRYIKKRDIVIDSSWLINHSEVIVLNHDNHTYLHSYFTSDSVLLRIDKCRGVQLGAENKFENKQGLYEGRAVYLKALKSADEDINVSLQFQMSKIKFLKHKNLCKFFGICLDDPHKYFMFEFCSHGNLYKLLTDSLVTMDWQLRYCLIHDIIEGLTYLHKYYGPHVNLRSTNCMINNRLVLKLSNFGLHYALPMAINHSDNYSKLLWTSPELQRQTEAAGYLAHKSDVYSFSIICQEIVYCKGPFYTGDDSLDLKVICERVASVNPEDYLRPFLNDEDLEDIKLGSLIRSCWSEKPADRPRFTLIKKKFSSLIKNRSSLLFTFRLEHYINSNEALVADLSRSFLQEKDTIELLEYSNVEKHIYDHLQNNPEDNSVRFCVSILYATWSNYDDICFCCNPKETLLVIEELISKISSVVDAFDVFKVLKMDDTLTLVSGFPRYNGNKHAKEIAYLALAIRDELYECALSNKPDLHVKMRFGIHSGPLFVVAYRSFVPCIELLGDTLSKAKMMERTGKPFLIHVSNSTKMILDLYDGFQLIPRNPDIIKTDAAFSSYWLLSAK